MPEWPVDNLLFHLARIGGDVRAQNPRPDRAIKGPPAIGPGYHQSRHQVERDGPIDGCSNPERQRSEHRRPGSKDAGWGQVATDESSGNREDDAGHAEHHAQAPVNLLPASLLRRELFEHPVVDVVKRNPIVRVIGIEGGVIVG
jgi:hypothetical protein